MKEEIKILDIKKSLDSFFNNREDQTRVTMINFLYGGISKLQEPNIAVSDRLLGTKKEYSLINEYSLKIVIPIKKTDRILDFFVEKWGDLTEKIHGDYNDYIKNLIVSEAYRT
jgi:hypothetical protein